MAERQPRCKEGRAWPLGNRGRARAGLRDGPLQKRRDVTGWRARGKPPCARGPRAEHSPQLVHHPHQHEERVLADALLERVGEGGELLVCGARVKETAILTRRDRDTSGRAALASCHALRATGAGVRHCPWWAEAGADLRLPLATPSPGWATFLWGQLSSCPGAASLGLSRGQWSQADA